MAPTLLRFGNSLNCTPPQAAPPCLVLLVILEQIGNAFELANHIVQYRIVLDTSPQTDGNDAFRLDVFGRVFQPKRFQLAENFFLMPVP